MESYWSARHAKMGKSGVGCMLSGDCLEFGLEELFEVTAIAGGFTISLFSGAMTWSLKKIYRAFTVSSTQLRKTLSFGTFVTATIIFLFNDLFATGELGSESMTGWD